MWIYSIKQFYLPNQRSNHFISSYLMKIAIITCPHTNFDENINFKRSYINTRKKILTLKYNIEIGHIVLFVMIICLLHNNLLNFSQPADTISYFRTSLVISLMQIVKIELNTFSEMIIG